MLSSTDDPGLSASKLVSPLPGPGGDDYDYGGDGGSGDEYTDHGDYDHELYQMIKIQCVVFHR